MQQEIYQQHKDFMQERISTDNLISTASAGSASTTLYIGNESILASGDIGSSVQGYDQQLADVAGLTPADGNIIIGNGTNFVTETGNTARTSLGVGLSDSPSFTGVNIKRTNSKQINMATDGSKNVTSVADLTSWIAGTANRVTVTSDGDGTLTLSAPQDMATTSAVTFGTVDTGQGANELYDMDQNVLTTSGCNIWISKNNRRSNGGYKHLNRKQYNKQGRYRDDSSIKNTQM